MAAGALKHRWSLRHNFLTGVTWLDWWRLLRENGFAVDPAYWHRAAFITLASAANSAHRLREERRHGSEIDEVMIDAPPLFVIGHWRSGTTHLHNLLAKDSAQFACPSTYQVANPHTFLRTEAWRPRIYARLLSQTRPMDNVALGFDTPQEDEFALALVTLRSFYLGAVFPRRAAYYDRYLTFEGVPATDVAEWRSGFRWFVKKLTLKHGRALVLKSPAHTARIAHLLELFPDARFVHVHRDPYEVFQSFCHYYDTAVWYMRLQRPDDNEVGERILRNYRRLYDAFFEQRNLIPHGRFHELRFADLERDPIGQLRALYEALSLPGFEAARPALEAYVASLSGYERNVFSALEERWRRAIAERWRRSFDEWGYAVEAR